MSLATFFIAAMVSLVTTVIFFAINGLILKYVAGWLDLGDDSFRTAYTVSAYAAIVSYVLSLIPSLFASLFLTVGRIVALFINGIFIIVNAIVFIWLIRKFYEVKWPDALKTWGILFIVNIVLGLIVGLVVGVLATAFAFGAARFA